MELEAKEMRMVILGLRKLLEDTQAKIKNLSENDDEYVFLSNDAMLIDTMIAGFKEEHQQKYAEK